MKYNGVCCNDKCPDLGDYPYPSRKCEGSCVYFEKEDGKIEEGKKYERRRKGSN